MNAVKGMGLSSAPTDAKNGGHAAELDPLAVPRNMAKEERRAKRSNQPTCKGCEKKSPTALGTKGLMWIHAANRDACEHVRRSVVEHLETCNTLMRDLIC